MATRRPRLKNDRHKLLTASASQAVQRDEQGSKGVDYLVRESTVYNAAMLLGMASKVLKPHVGAKPALGEVLEALPELVRRDAKGDQARELALVEDLIAPGGTWVGWVVPAGPDRVLVCPASAATVEADGDEAANAFTAALCAWVSGRRASHLHTGPFSRLGRRVPYLAEIKDSLGKAGTKFSCSEASDLDPSDPHTGGYVWGILAAQSESEWLNILERNFAGKVFSAQSGRYPNGVRVMPLGYTKVEKGELKGRPVPELDVWPVVNAMLRAAAEETEPEELLTRWEEIGVPRMRNDARDEGLGETVGSLQSRPLAIIQRRLAWLDTYLTGTFELEMVSPLPPGHVLSLHGVDLEVKMLDPDNPELGGDPDDPGRVFIDVSAGLPEGEVVTPDGPLQVSAWADAETFAAVRANWAPGGRCGACAVCVGAEEGVCARHHELTGEVGRQRPGGGYALAGLPTWIAGGYEFKLVLRGAAHGNPGTYMLHRRPAAMAGKGWVAPYDGTHVASVRGSDMLAAVVELLSGEADAAVVRGGTTLTPVEIQQLRDRIVELEQAAVRHRAGADAMEANLEDLPETVHETMKASIADLRAQAETAEQDAEDARRELRSEQPVEGVEVRVESSPLAALSALLKQSSDGWLPRQACRTLARLLGGSLRVDPAGNPMRVSAKLSLARLTADRERLSGSVVLEVSTTVANRLRTAPDGQSLTDVRVGEALERLMTSDRTVADVARDFGWAEGTARNHLGPALAAMLPSGAVAAAVLLDCPLLELRWAVWSDVSGTPLPTDLDLDEAYVTLARQTMLDPDLSWGRTWASKGHDFRRRTLDYIDSHRDELPDGLYATEAVEVLELSDGQLRALRGAVHRMDFPAVVDVPSWVVNRWTDDRRLDAIVCPHCKKEGVVSYADHVLRVPEVWDAVLCRRCRRMPSRSAVFPASYLQRWATPAELPGTQRWSGSGVAKKKTPPRRPQRFRTRSA